MSRAHGEAASPVGHGTSAGGGRGRVHSSARTARGRLRHGHRRGAVGKGSCPQFDEHEQGADRLGPDVGVLAIVSLTSIRTRRSTARPSGLSPRRATIRLPGWPRTLVAGACPCGPACVHAGQWPYGPASRRGWFADLLGATLAARGSTLGRRALEGLIRAVYVGGWCCPRAGPVRTAPVEARACVGC